MTWPPDHAAPLRRPRTWIIGAMLAWVLLAPGCSAERKAPPDPAARAQALIESGNHAFSAGDYGLAARRYAAAAVVRKDDPAAYYGLGMALSRLGRDEDARAAYAHARQLAHERRVSGDTTSKQ